MITSGSTDDERAPDYGKSGRFLLQLLNPEGIYMPSFGQWNQNKMRKFWFRGKTSAFFGGENIRKVEDKLVKKTDQQPGFFQKYGAILIAALLLLGLVIAGAGIPL